MKQEMYMFGAILMVMTIISTLGGAIRYEENFYNEVFDLLDETDGVQGDDQKDLADTAENLPQNNDESLMTEETVPPMSVEEEQVEMEPSVVINEPVKEMAEESAEESAEENIEAYEEGQFASF